MNDDIVTRLRAMVQWCENPKCEGCEVENEAIDEIERLRKLLHRWETCELVAESLCDMDNPESFCDICKELF